MDPITLRSNAVSQAIDLYKAADLYPVDNDMADFLADVEAIHAYVKEGTVPERKQVPTSE